MEKTPYYILVLQITIIFMNSQKSCLAATNYATDQSALLALKSHITLDPYNFITTNWTNSTSVCNWIGVTCGSRHNRVTALNISYMFLSGTIPPQIGNLSFLISLDLSRNFFGGVLPQLLPHRLKYISLRNNNFTGNIPVSLSNLTKLQLVDFSSNFFQGNIPKELGNLQSLQAFRMENNRLSGTIPLALGVNNLNGVIPPEIGNLQNLVQFAAEKNRITGAIPPGIFNISSLQLVLLHYNELSGNLPKEIGNFTQLRNLTLAYNKLTGDLPREMGKLYQLEDLVLEFNAFTGVVPLELFNMSNLRGLGLNGNGLFGSLPKNIDRGLPALEKLAIASNYFTGEIPESIANCSKLRLLELGSNNFTGLVPNSLGNLRLLERLGLFNNNLSSSSSELSFITSLTNCRSLYELAISDNPIDGILPTSVGNLSKSLQIFYAYNCELKGTIPPEIGNLSNLVTLALGGNELSGEIPIGIKNMHMLQGLSLDYNKMSGSVFPEGLCDLDSLVYLYLNHNNFSGTIPECLGNVTSLRNLYLDSNMLTSTIPSSVWRLADLLKLNFSSNLLSGFIPLEIGNLVTATVIDLSMNRLSESIPSAIGKLTSLTYLSLAHNGLEGSIPESVGSMVSLVTVDLSYNNLSGSIPKSLESLSSLHHFNVSYNALVGEIPTDGPFRNFTIDSFMANDALCGVPRFYVPPCGNVSEHRSRMKRVRSGLFIVIGIVAFISILSLAFIFVRYRRKYVAANGGIDGVVSTLPERISYYELLQATEQFSETNLLGTGSFGSVYKGVLRDGNILAVRVFNSLSEAASKSFDVECEVLRNIRHRNLTKVVSSCSNEDFKALVLEYMPNGNLDKWLYSHNYCLDVFQRLNIMIDVACALEYLHHGYSSPIVHRDLKPSNVLLDEEMVAHVSDFGIAKLLGDGESIVHTNTLATLGYIAPEYGLEGLVSTRCDVYSYGVMVMEAFTRKTPSDDMFAEGLSLKSWVQSSLRQSTNEVIDSNLLNTENEQDFEKNLQCVSSILELALKCLAESPGDRITMKEALAELQKIKGRFSPVIRR
ncbi:hypothetical protein ABFS83_14G056300 [Erythranthe nasuta]